MVRTLYIFILLALLLSVPGCQKETRTTTDSVPPKVNTEKLKETCSSTARQLHAEFEQIKAEKDWLDFDSCLKLENAVSLLAMEKSSSGKWISSEEQRLRRQLKDEFGITVPEDKMALGFVEHLSSDASRIVLVEANRGSSYEAAGYLAYAEKTMNSGKPFGAEEARWQLNESWTPFGYLGLYHLDNPSKKTRWIEIYSANKWGPDDPMRGQALSCPDCKGWFCASGPAICITDFNANGLIELQFKGNGPSFNDILVLELTPEGDTQVLLDVQNGLGHWEMFGQQWVFMGEVTCEGGAFCGREELGNHNCYRPEIQSFDKAGRLINNPEITNRVYPVQVMKAPEGCTVDKPEGTLVFTLDKKFVRYVQ